MFPLIFPGACTRKFLLHNSNWNNMAAPTATRTCLILERVPGNAEPRRLYVAASPFVGKQALLAAAREKAGGEGSVYRHNQVADVPQQGTLIFHGDENPSVPVLNVVRRVPGYLWGYREELLASYEMETVPIWSSQPSPVSRGDSLAAPARMVVNDGDSEERKQEAAKRENLFREVSSSLGQLKLKKKIIDGRDIFHNELVNSVILMEERRGRTLADPEDSAADPKTKTE